MAKEIQLFPLLKIMFSDENQYSKLRETDKSKNFFMINRRFSINFPTVAHQFNHIKTPGNKVVDCWQRVASQYKRTPGWMYTKTKKTPKKKTTRKKLKTGGFNYKTYQPEPEILRLFFNKREISSKVYEAALKMNEEATKYKIWDFEQRIKVT